MAFRNIPLLVLLAVLTGCASGASEGRYLPPGPLAPIGGARAGDVNAVVPAVPQSLSAPPRSAPMRSPSTSDLLAGLVASDGLGRLPGARVAGVGPVHGIAVSISLTGRPPARDEKALTAEVLGGGAGDTGATIARALDAASGGKFRLTFSSLPALVAPAGARSGDVARLRELASSSLRSWSRQLDMRGFDNDGPDGLPGSADDDGVVDFFLLAVEGTEDVPSVTLKDGVPAGSGSARLETGPIHVLGLTGGDPLLAGIGLVLGAAGLDGSERFFPSGFPRMISTLARVRLGWVQTTRARPSATADEVLEGQVRLIPLRDVADGGGFWLVENDGRSTYATRAVRGPGDHFTPTDVRVWQPGTAMVLPLSRQLGELGERVVLQGSSTPTLQWVGLRAGPANEAPAAIPVRW